MDDPLIDLLKRLSETTEEEGKEIVEELDYMNEEDVELLKIAMIKEMERRKNLN